MNELTECSRNELHHQPRMILWMLSFVVGVGILQITFRSSPLSNLPGKQRGDLGLTAEALPQELAGWKAEGFEPAPPPESLPQGQYWWVHTWRFTQSSLIALVTFDQLGLDHWHELTDCYEGNGWELKERTVHSVTGQGSDSTQRNEWEYVVAHFEKATGGKATLIFSTFYEDGSPAQALRIGINHKWDDDLRLKERLWNRVGGLTDADHEGIRHSRALQCQVFLPYSGTLTPELAQSAVDLHISTRELFRKLWGQHSETNPVAFDTDN